MIVTLRFFKVKSFALCITCHCALEGLGVAKLDEIFVGACDVSVWISLCILFFSNLT